jgi:hypothetical protein
MGFSPASARRRFALAIAFESVSRTCFAIRRTLPQALKHLNSSPGTAIPVPGAILASLRARDSKKSALSTHSPKPIEVLMLFQSNPIQSNPIQSNPIQSNPIQSNPIQSTPRHWHFTNHEQGGLSIRRSRFTGDSELSRRTQVGEMCWQTITLSSHQTLEQAVAAAEKHSLVASR